MANSSREKADAEARAVVTGAEARAVVTGAGGQQPQSAVVTMADAQRMAEADLTRRHAELATKLAGQYPADYFAGLVLTQLRRLPAATQLKIAGTPQGRTSLVQAAYQAAELRLPFLMGRAYLVPYGDEVQFQIGYQGLVDLVTAPGTGVTFVEAATVYSRDTFDYMRGSGAYLRHREYVPDITADTKQADMVYDRGVRTFYWARVVFANGQERWDVMPYAAVEAIRKRSKGGSSGPWSTDYDEMGKKTVLRRLCKTLRISLQVMEVIDREDALESQAVPVQGQASATAQVRQQVQARLGGPQDVQGADSADPGPAPDSVAAAGPAVHVDVAALDTTPDGSPSTPAADSGTTPQAAAVCGATLQDGDDLWTCTMAPRHRGVHTDGQHDWPQGM